MIFFLFLISSAKGGTNIAGCADEYQDLLVYSCRQCSAGYYLVVVPLFSDRCPTCSSAMRNCTLCTNESHCLNCAYGYTPYNRASSCQLCRSVYERCSSCNRTSMGCLQCDTGYTWTGSNCTLCSKAIEGCESCDPTTRICLRCKQGHMPYSSTHCVPCATGINKRDECRRDSKTCTAKKDTR